MDIFTAASHADILRLVFQIAVLLLSARLLGEVSQRLGQPAVLGEIAAGVILGPSLLSGLIPAFGQWLLPQTAVQGYLIEVIGLLGAMFLLLMTGLETDIPLVRRHARTAVGVAAGGLVLPFASGAVMAYFLPDFLHAEGQSNVVFILFVATAMSISAIPVIAKVLLDMNLMRRDIGQAIMAAGMIDDTVAWMMLLIVLGLVGGGAVTFGLVAASVGKIVLFMVLSFTLGRLILKKTLDFVQDRFISTDRLLTLIVAAAFVWGAIAQAIQIEAVLGAFVVGVLFGTMRRLPDQVIQKLDSVAMAIFAPIFFAVAGLKVDVTRLFSPQLLLIALIVILVATFGKIVGAYVGARAVGVGHWQGLAFGSALNARGAVQIIIATIGLSLGVLSQDMYSIIILMAIVTSVMAPFLLRWTLSHVVPEEQELKRLEAERLAEGSVVANISRVLLPVRSRPGQDEAAYRSLEAHLLRSIGHDLALTLLTVATPETRGRSQEFLTNLAESFPDMEVSRKVVEGGNAADVILDEATKDYQLIILGAPEASGSSEVVFSPMIDYVMRVAPCATMVVKGRSGDRNWPPKRILVPTNGSAASRHAAEVAFALAHDGGVQVTLLNVVTGGATGYYSDAGGASFDRQLGNAHQIVNTLREIGEAQGVLSQTAIRVGAKPDSVILDVAERQQVDLIVLGTDLRPASQRLYLGARVERILDSAPCPVIVLNTH
jgi:Kef-type K+ transport system membrane component KefB/nucleotide-binding universal stress UspA family protein